jgi:hypothetical protein
MTTKPLLSVSFATLVLLGLSLSDASASSAGQKCTRVGALSGTKQAPLVCTRVGKKLIWKSAQTTSTTVKVNETASQRNAKSSAQSYLRFMSFSRTGLIRQLEFEKYSTTDATYAVDALNINWNDQAAKSAKSYLKTMPFSRAGLIDQLIFEGFTQAQAEYGVGANGL